jgi:hypothetical protein
MELGSGFRVRALVCTDLTGTLPASATTSRCSARTSLAPRKLAFFADPFRNLIELAEVV